MNNKKRQSAPRQSGQSTNRPIGHAGSRSKQNISTQTTAATTTRKSNYANRSRVAPRQNAKKSTASNTPPTSLANLAQLSGLTMLPGAMIDEENSQDCSDDLFSDPLAIPPEPSPRVAFDQQVNYQMDTDIDEIETNCANNDQLNFTQSPAYYNDSYTDTSNIATILTSTNESDDDMNSISLMRLLSILKNPALTITAVSPRDTSQTQSNSNTAQDQSNISQPTTSISIHENVQAKKVQPNSTSNSIASSLEEHLRKQISPRGHIPQSLANLQAPLATNATKNAVPDSGKLQTTKKNLKTNKTKSSRDSCQMNPEDLDWTSDQNGINCSELEYSLDQVQDPLSLSTRDSDLLRPRGTAPEPNNNLSARLLKHIASQNCFDSSDDWNPIAEAPDIEVACEPVPSIKPIVRDLNLGVKIMQRPKIVTSECPQRKKLKRKLQTSKLRLYIPPPPLDDDTSENVIDYFLNPIAIEDGQEREVYLSKDHSILETLLSSGSVDETGDLGPDDIFVNRSKRVMSKVDMMLERKKKRRFERISSRAEPKTSSLEEQCAESENEWSADEDFDCLPLISSQLPLSGEDETEDKRQHLASVGLVSRAARDRILIEQCEMKLNLISPFYLESIDSFANDQKHLKEFAKAISSPMGVDSTQWRIDSNIKRIDLPLVERLNRNTGRQKLSYMNLLGLDKRSKRTTLYKVSRSSATDPNKNLQSIPCSGKQVDLNENIDSLRGNNIITLDNRSQHQGQRLENGQGRKVQHLEASVRLEKHAEKDKLSNSRATHLKSNCRVDMQQLPSKDDYMKSLGLMAS